MATARRLAREQKLRAVRYLDSEGKVGARGDQVHRIELEFSNDAVVKLTPRELSVLKDLHFDLQRASS